MRGVAIYFLTGERKLLDTMDELNLSPMFDLLTLLDLPALPAAFTNRTGNYIEQAATVKRILGFDIFFGLEIMPDPRNKSRNIIFLDVPETTSPFPKYVHPSIPL